MKYIVVMRVLLVLGEANGTATDDAMAAAMVAAVKFTIDIKLCLCRAQSLFKLLHVCKGNMHTI